MSTEKKHGNLRGGTEDGAVTNDGKHKVHGAPGSHEGTSSMGRSGSDVAHPEDMKPSTGRRD